MDRNGLTALLAALVIGTTVACQGEDPSYAELQRRVERLEIVCRQQDALLLEHSAQVAEGKIDMAYLQGKVSRLREFYDQQARDEERGRQLLEETSPIRSIYENATDSSGLTATTTQWMERVQKEWSWPWMRLGLSPGLTESVK